MDTEKNTNLKADVPTMAEMAAAGKSPEVLFWVGCAGSFGSTIFHNNLR